MREHNCIFLWLISLSLMPSWSTHIVAKSRMSFFFFMAEYSIVSIYTFSLSVYPSMDTYIVSMTFASSLGAKLTLWFLWYYSILLLLFLRPLSLCLLYVSSPCSPNAAFSGALFSTGLSSFPVIIQLINSQDTNDDLPTYWSTLNLCWVLSLTFHLYINVPHLKYTSNRASPLYL